MITPNLNIAYRGGWCEKGVENAFGTNGIYTSAMVAWRNNIQHIGIPPKGIYAPVYIDLPNGPKDENGTQGDVAIWCLDGTVAACALAGHNIGLYKYSSLQAYIDDYARANNGAIYKGWGEYVGNIRVVEMEENMDAQDIRNIGGEIWNGIGEETVQNLKGKSWHDVMYYLVQTYPWINRKNQAIINSELIVKLNSQIKMLQTTNKDLQNKLDSYKNIVVPSSNQANLDIEKDTNTKVNKILELLQSLISKITSIFK